MLLCLQLCGCTAYRSWWRKSFLPDCVVTGKLYAEAPQRVVVLPFAPAPGKTGRIDVTEKSAVACRNTFYRHFSVSRFEDVELHKVDKVVHAESARHASKPWRAVRLARSVDVIGVRSLLNLHRVLRASPWAAPECREAMDKLRRAFDADAYAIGATRDFGWLYAVVFSSVTVACKMEIRSCRTGDLLWRGEWKQRSFAHALDTAFWIIPYRLIEVWRHARGEVLEGVTDQVFRDFVETIPYVERPTKVLVQPLKPQTRTYEKNSATFWNMNGIVSQDERLPLVSVHPGWYRCQHPKLGDCWIFEDDAKLVDESGKAVQPRGKRWFGADAPRPYEPYTREDTVGVSVQGRPIRALEVGRGHEVVLVMGAFHGDEWQSSYVAERLGDYLVATGRVPSDRKVVVVPAVNPDGLAARTRCNSRGVDINRNFPAANWRCAGAESPGRHGMAPGSEPETQAVMALLRRLQPQVIVSIHTTRRGPQCVNYDGPAEALAEAMSQRCGYPAKKHIGYATPGSFGTYAGIERQIPTITLELPQAENAAVCWHDVRDALLEAVAYTRVTVATDHGQ